MFPGCRGHTQLQQRLRRNCIFPTLLLPHKYAVLKRDYRVGVRAEGFIWTVSAVNRRLILDMFHRRQRRGLAGPVAGEATALKLLGIVLGFTVRSHTPGHPHERLRREQVHLHELFGRGRNISFPKDTAMEIGFGGQTATPISSSP
jgi:hypothetical protein